MTEDFPWGEVIKLHKIDGLPVIVEYRVGAAFHNPGSTEFNITYEDGSSWSYDSLDEAILDALYKKNQDKNALWHTIGVLCEHSELERHFKHGSEDA